MSKKFWKQKNRLLSSSADKKGKTVGRAKRQRFFFPCLLFCLFQTGNDAMMSISSADTTTTNPEIITEKYSFALTIHLPFVGKDDFPASARRINGQSLLETLFNIGTPDALGVGRCQIFFVLFKWQEIRIMSVGFNFDLNQSTKEQFENLLMIYIYKWAIYIAG